MATKDKQPLPLDRLSYVEIGGWSRFQRLVAAYFEKAKEDRSLLIDQVNAHTTGVGSDGGRDILVDLIMNDGIRAYKRRWVVQCKYKKDSVSPTDLRSVNIPSLVHSYSADGYLLVCKGEVTSGVTNLFEALNNNCSFKKTYAYWTGDELLDKIRLQSALIPIFFPRHDAFRKPKRQSIKKVLHR